MAAASTSTSFNTLKREAAFRNPNPDGPAVPMLEELVRPHIESFDALFDDAGGPGLIQLAIDDMTPKVIFDGSNGMQDVKMGNRLESTFESKLGLRATKHCSRSQSSWSDSCQTPHEREFA
jgi:DNA-directed RNA polymerase I subunit RPA2